MRDLTPAEANRRALDVFVGIDADAALPGMREACAHWQPDLVLSEPSEFAGGLVAGQLDLPVVTVAITQLAVEHELRDATRAALDRLRTAHGLRASNGAGSARFTLMPEVLEDPAHPGPPGVHRFREPDAAAPAPLPDWWERDADPLVYVTFGSVAAGMGFFPDLFRAAIDALAALPVRLLVTVGRDHDPLELGDVAPNVHVERWIPQAAILPHAAAVVCHGGSGTVRGGLAAGLPLVVLPLFADQSHNAARVQALGAGIALDQGVGALAGAVRR